MKRLRGWLLNAITAMSLLLCLASAMLWMHSNFNDDRVDLGFDTSDGHGASAEIGACRGLWFVDIDRRVGTKIRGMPTLDWSFTPPPELAPLIIDILGDVPRFAGFGFRADRSLDQLDQYFISVIPLWFLTGLFAILPAWRIFKHLRRPRESGRCATCGYDLRATPTRCPECGTVPL